jgi:hypothetical protein
VCSYASGCPIVTGYLTLRCVYAQVFFLTCAGTKVYPDPRMTSVDAALAFAKSSQLQVVPAALQQLPASCICICTGRFSCWNRIAKEIQQGMYGHRSSALIDTQGVVVEASGMADRLEEVLLLFLDVCP